MLLSAVCIKIGLAWIITFSHSQSVPINSISYDLLMESAASPTSYAEKFIHKKLISFAYSF